MFKNESGDNHYPLFWSDVAPNGNVNNSDFRFRDKIIYCIGDDYVKEDNYIAGEVYAYDHLELLDYERSL